MNGAGLSYRNQPFADRSSGCPRCDAKWMSRMTDEAEVCMACTKSEPAASLDGSSRNVPSTQRFQAAASEHACARYPTAELPTLAYLPTAEDRSPFTYGSPLAPQQLAHHQGSGMNISSGGYPYPSSSQLFRSRLEAEYVDLVLPIMLLIH